MAKKVTSPTVKELDALYEMVLQIPDLKTARKFFRDLCTLSELKAMTERFEVMKRIEAGENYRDISKATGVSTATITRVAHWIRHGMGGYKWALKTLRSLTKEDK